MAQRIWIVCPEDIATGIDEGTLDSEREAHARAERPAGFVAAVVAKLAWFVVLEVALWCVGIGPDVQPPSAVLAAMAVVGIVALVPITPGAVGVTEVAYIGILSSVAGSGMSEQLTAAVMLFRTPEVRADPDRGVVVGEPAPGRRSLWVRRPGGAGSRRAGQTVNRKAHHVVVGIAEGVLFEVVPRRRGIVAEQVLDVTVGSTIGRSSGSRLRSVVSYHGVAPTR